MRKLFTFSLSSSASGTVISKFGNGAQNAVHTAEPTQPWSVYPNPMYGNTNISYMLEKRSAVKIEMYNLLGQLVMTVLDQYQDPGTYENHFDSSTLPSGSYLIRLTINNKSQARCLNVLRK